jgi:Asp-tRNA(Asn)/Glu-tRNA(Gln) amidotransferase A subunit family amidase
MNNDAFQQVSHSIDRIAGREEEIHAFAFLAKDSAQQRAVALDELPRSTKKALPLFGVPIAIKDVIHVAGMPTAAGSAILEGFEPEQDAECIRMLRDGGAILLGKTATSEFAFLDPAKTRNPRNLMHTPGGSSSGSAAAVAAGFCPAAIGTQTFGSVVRPASYCGVIGFKPTHGAISRDGVIPLSWTLDHVGILGRSVTLAARLADALFAADYPGERPSALGEHTKRRLRDASEKNVVGIPDRYFVDNVDRTVREGYEQGVGALGSAGARIQPIRLPPLFEPAVAAAGIILRVEAATFHRKWFPERSADYGPRLRCLIESGNSIPSVEYLKARQIRQAARKQMRAVWKEVDFLATPSTPSVAPPGLDSTGDPVFNTPFSVLGNPAITMPSAYCSSTGLPAGLQLIAPVWADAALLRLALSLEKTGFGQVLPPATEGTNAV